MLHCGLPIATSDEGPKARGERERERERRAGERERDDAQEQALAPHCKLGAGGLATTYTVVIKGECARFRMVFEFKFVEVAQIKCELTVPVAQSLCTSACSQVVALGLPPPPLETETYMFDSCH